MIDLKIKGGDQLDDLARALREAGDKALKRELFKGMNRATKPLKAAAQKEAAARLPKSGGLAARVAKARISTKTSTGKNVSVSLTCKDGAAATTDRGFVMHPVYGNKSAWVRQSVDPGWFTDTMRENAELVRKELIEAMDAVADQIKRS